MNIVPIKYDENNKYHRFARTAVITVISLSGFLLLWWFISVVANVAAVPSPGLTFQALIEFALYGDQLTNLTLWDAIASSMMTFFKGFLLALAVAVPLGLILGYSKFLNSLCTPIIEVLRPIAPIAWAPIFIITVGFEWGPMLVVFVGIVFPLLTNVIFGVQKIDKDLIDASRTLGASQLQIFSKVMVPSAVPYVMNGIKIGLGVGWMCIVAAELYSSELGGIGTFLNAQAVNGYWPGAYAAVVVIAILGLMTTGVADYIHRMVSKRMGME